MPHDAEDDSFMKQHSCESGLRGLWALRRMQMARTCRRALFYAGETHGEPVVEICLDGNALRGDCTVFSVGIAYNFVFDDMMHDRGCRVYSFDPSMKMEETVRRTDPISVFQPIGIAGYDGVEKTSGTFFNIPNVRPPPYEVRRLETLMEMHGVAKIDLLRMDTEGAEWGILGEWNAKGTWSLFDQLSLEVHIERGHSTHAAGEWNRRADILSRIPYAPTFAAPNWHSRPLHVNQNFLPNIREAFEVSYVKAPYRSRPVITADFWRRWGYELDGDLNRPAPPLFRQMFNDGDHLAYVKETLSKVVRDGCLSGVQVTEDGAPARVCTKLLKAGECRMYIISDQETATNAELASVLAEEGCTTVEYRVGGDGEAAGGARRMVAVTQRDVEDPGWLWKAMREDGLSSVDVLRVDAGPVLTERLLQAWEEDYKTYAGGAGPKPALTLVAQLSVRLSVLEDLSNAKGVARALGEQVKAFRQPYYSALGEMVETARGKACTYEVSYVRGQ
eukprot:TRINITY_DN2774_c0_g2_i6.p1 TRINITY_DN2774_c0_g2~~TRINITY_DN2774_c0_g2_i6.p1  ORF type:complete len:577 (+),score=158.20 TRINITY_DN2774_c0_g2_i6:222-1733(+)